MESLYHYCSVNTLKSILKNKTLRLSDITKSNDSNEIKFFFNEYYKLTPKNDNTSLVKNFYKKEFENQMNNSVILVFCLSKNKDNVHMWNCYGNNGVCIEFDRDILKQSLKSVGLGICDYIKEKYKNDNITASKADLLLDDVIYFKKNEVKKYIEEHGIKKIDDKGGFNSFYEVLKLCPFVKSDFFKCEKEARIVYVRMFGEQDNDPLTAFNNISKIDEDGNILKLINFDSVSNNDYPHRMVIDIPLDTKAIKSITIGPNCKLNEKDINELFFIYGIEKKDIHQSKGTLR